jgi:imidazolonepropionase
MACTLFRMTVAEALAGVTAHAARALGQGGRHGLLAAGREADFAIWSVESLAELAYWTGLNRCGGVVRAGVRVR